MFGIFKKKKDTEKKTLLSLKDKEMLLDYIHRTTEKPACRIKVKEGKAEITDSKFGGYPYWEKNLAYPQTKEGEKLLLLAQINFGKEGFENELLPDHGILQFFVADDDVTGLNFEDGTLQDTFRIVYHENPDGTITGEDVLCMGIPSNTDKEHEDSYFPFHYEKPICFEKGIDCIGNSVTGFEETFADAYLKCLGKEFPEDATWWEVFDDEGMDLFDEKINNWGHKILGYPAFTQMDPRVDINDYDVLLFQMDSQDDIMWGDSGICNFFIGREKLMNLDFSDVIYNWDCY